MTAARPAHLSGPEWHGWDDLFAPADIRFEACDLGGLRGWYEVASINGRAVMHIERRPHYCDRGRFRVLCDLPDIDAADAFPRYYMSEATMRAEVIAFLNWRLWRRDP